MRRMGWAVMLLVLGLAAPVRAQMGMGDLFKRPSFTKVFHPVVGQGAEYQTTSKGRQDTATRTMQMGIVGKEGTVGGDSYWMETVIQGEGKTIVMKLLMAPGDFQVSRSIMQMPGQPAMEMPVNMSGANRAKVVNSMEDWHSVGTETVTVPAGTFSTEHWKNDKTGDEVWTSDKVTPFGLVKQVGKDSSMVLTKVLSEYPDRITGPVQKFDPQLMMQQMQQGSRPQQ
jgi:hypothetical protein